MYGLGSLVKKATRGIKKIIKSPIGKAALLGGLGMYGMGAGPFTKGKFGAGFLKNLGIGKYLNPWSGAFGEKGKFSGKHAFGLLGATGIAMPFVQKALGWGPYKPEEEVEEDDWTVTPGSIANLRNQARDYYTAATPDYLGSPFMPNKQYVMPNFYAADGGRAGLLNGGGAGEAQIEQMLRAEYLKYKNKGGTMPYEQFKILVMKQAQQGQMPNQMMADGGRIGLDSGGDTGQIDLMGDLSQEDLNLYGSLKKGLWSLLDDAPGTASNIFEGLNLFDDKDVDWSGTSMRGRHKAFDDAEQKLLFGLISTKNNPEERIKFVEEFKDTFNMKAQGGRIGKQEGGLMDLGGQEKDYRDEGGFVALGGEERADDVPARLSKNEFVFTADAVRNAGGGDIDKGSEVMQNLMDNLEQGGEVSEDSQGQNPAQGMYDKYEQLQSRVA